MQFSDTSTKKGLIQECEFLTNLGDAAISGDATLLANFVRLLNARYHQVVTLVLQSQDEWDFDDINHTDYPILTTSLVANQQDYVIPASEKVLKFHRVEVTYDGTEWRKATPLDIGERHAPTNTSSISDDFSTSDPFYDLIANALFLYPIPTSNVTGGLKVWWTREIDEFVAADTTQEPGVDEDFHRMIAVGASLDWAMVFDEKKAARLQNVWDREVARLQAHYNRKQKDRDLVIRGAYSIEDYK